MDVTLSHSTVNNAVGQVNRQTPDAVNVAVLKKALNAQETSATTLLSALPQAQPALATSGALGTQVNTFA